MLTIVLVLNSVLAAYYYLKVLVYMYMRDPETEEVPLPVSFGMAAVMVIAVVGVIYLGIAPGRILDLLGDTRNLR